MDAVARKLGAMLLPRVLACTRSQLAPLSTRHSMARLPPLAAHRARMLSDATSKAAGDAASSAEAAAEAAAEPAKEASEAGAAEEEAAEDPIAQLEARVSELDKELAEKHDQMLRALAEADNARRRARLDVENSHKFGVSKFAKDLLEVADNLSRAADSVPEEMRSSDEHPVLKALYEGVIMTDDQLVKTFGKHGASSSPPPLRPSIPSTTRRPPHPKLTCHPTCLVLRPHQAQPSRREVRPQLPCAARLGTMPALLTLLLQPPPPAACLRTPYLTTLLPCLCQDAVFEAPDPTKEPGTVMHVASPGYIMHERCLRAASVGVVKKA